MNRGFLLVALVGCSNGDELARVAEAMGGAGALAALRTQTFSASGKRFDRYEAFGLDGDEGVEQLDYTATISLDFAARAQRSEWSGVTTYVFPGTTATWTEISSGQYGQISMDSAAGAMAPRPMLSSQVTARWKQLSLASPHHLINHALANPESVTQSDGVLSVIGLDGARQPVRIFVDPSTHLPARIETLEDDPMLGDVLFETAFSGWQRIGEVEVPLEVTQSVGGMLVQREERSMVVDNPSLAADTFSVPESVQGTFDQRLADWGARSSQYFLRFQAFLFPFYDDVSKTVMRIPVSTEPGREIAFFAASFYNTMVVEMPTYLVAVEAPFYESLSQAVIAQIEEHWPGKPIQYVVNTHFHFDHSGGLRTYAARGAEVLTAAQNQGLFAALMKAPHTVQQDELAMSARTAKVTGIADELRLTDGDRTVVLYNVEESHSDGHLIVYVPDAQLLFTTDLYNPGSQGPMPMGAERPDHDLYARELLDRLAGLGLDETTIQTFVGGHGYATGSWTELRIFAGM